MTGLIVGLVIGVLVGLLVGLLVVRGRSAATAARLADAQDALARQGDELGQGRRELEAARADGARLAAQVEHQHLAVAERGRGGRGGPPASCWARSPSSPARPSSATPSSSSPWPTPG